MSQEPEQGNIPSDSEEFSRILTELEDLVKIALAAEKKEVRVSLSSFVDVHKQLMEVYRRIELFRASYSETLAQFGLKPEDMRPTPEEIESLSPKEKKILQKLNSLRTTCEDAKERVHESLQKNKQATKEIKEELKGKEREQVRRKGKFKGVGGKKGWLPT